MQAGDVARRAGPQPLQERHAGLSLQAADGGVGGPGAVVEREGGEGGPLRRPEGPHGVVETGKGHPPRPVVEGGHQPAGPVGGVGDGAAEHAGVQVAPGGADVDVEGHQPPHAGRDRRHVGRPHAGVGDDHHGAGQAGPLRLQQRLEVGAADLLLALDDDLHVDRHLAGAVPAEEAADGLEVAEDLALVVAGAPAEQPAGPQGGLEGRGGPLVQRVDGLDVVVAVDQRRRGAVGVEPVAVDGRVPLCGQDLDVLEAGRGHALGAPLGR